MNLVLSWIHVSRFPPLPALLVSRVCLGTNVLEINIEAEGKKNFESVSTIMTGNTDTPRPRGVHLTQILRRVAYPFRSCVGNWGEFQISSNRWTDIVMKGQVEIGHLTKFGALRLNRDQVMTLETIMVRARGLKILIIWPCLKRTGYKKIQEFDWLKSILTAV